MTKIDNRGCGTIIIVDTIFCKSTRLILGSLPASARYGPKNERRRNTAGGKDRVGNQRRSVAAVYLAISLSFVGVVCVARTRTQR